MKYRRWVFGCALVLWALVGCADEGIEPLPQPTLPVTAVDPTLQPTLELTEVVQPDVVGDEPVFPLFLEDPYQQGADIASLQARLVALGYLAEEYVTMQYDPATEEAVRLFQTNNRLDVDGVVGPLTWDALFADSAQSIELVGEPDIYQGWLVYLGPDGKTLYRRSRNDANEDVLLELPIGLDEQVLELSASPDGRFFAVLFGDAFSDLTQVYIYYADGSLLATYGGMDSLKWSPSGDYFMVSSFYEDTQGQRINTVLAFATERADEAGPVLDTAADAGAWSSDGTWVALIRNGDTVIKHDLQTAEETFVALLGADWYIQDLLLLAATDTVYVYAGDINDLGASGNGMQWWSLPIVDTVACQQSAEGCGELVAQTEPNGNSVAYLHYNPQFDRLAYSESVRASACVTYQEVVVADLVSDGFQTTYAPLPFEVPEDGGLMTKGLTWLGVEPALAFAYQTYVCSAQELIPDISQVFIVYDDGSLELVGEGSFPIWLP